MLQHVGDGSVAGSHNAGYTVIEHAAGTDHGPVAGTHDVSEPGNVEGRGVESGPLPSADEVMAAIVADRAADGAAHTASRIDDVRARHPEVSLDQATPRVSAGAPPHN